MRIGVLALQGAFAEHIKALNAINAESFEIRQKKDLERGMDGLILPGGESTVMGKLLRDLDMYEPVRELITGRMPVFGTCAGLLLLAEKIHNDDRKHFQTMSITAVRNAYGRQLGSFNTVSPFGNKGEIPMVFIRAPYISETGNNVEVLSFADGKIVAARQDRQLVTAFHPELTDDLTVHKYFLEEIVGCG